MGLPSAPGPGPPLRAGGRVPGPSLAHPEMLWASSSLNSPLERAWSQVSLQERWAGGKCTGPGGCVIHRRPAGAN